jgi:predicted NACHT family NTPase
MDRQTIQKFFKGTGIDRKNFVAICETLGLDWQVVVGEKPPEDVDVDTLVEQAQQRARADIEHVFEQFTEVEIADFRDEQIQDFADKWFKAKEPDQVDADGRSTIAQLFWQALAAREPIKELATNPLLLTLLCLEFGESSAFPQSRAELYERGLNILLSKWDGQRRIKRDEVYQRLSTHRKESLLGQLAMQTFARGEYFFKQHVAEKQIGQYIQNLPDARTDPEALWVDSRAVLKAIEAQHGLLTERATGIYSFSHLTFHEYFTAKNILDTTEPTAQAAALEKLISHVAEKHWREIFLLVAERMDSADYLLTRMKQQIDQMLAADATLQQFLVWVEQKSQSVETPYKAVAVRAFYFAPPLDLARDLARDLALARDRARLCEPELQRSLQTLKDQLPDIAPENAENFEQWWLANGAAWAEQLKTVMIQHRNIGHDWQFSNAQMKLLKQYYDANKFLVDCLNSECYVSRDVRQTLEATLLLPVRSGMDKAILNDS